MKRIFSIAIALIMICSLLAVPALITTIIWERKYKTLLSAEADRKSAK